MALKDKKLYDLVANLTVIFDPELSNVLRMSMSNVDARKDTTGLGY